MDLKTLLIVVIAPSLGSMLVHALIYAVHRARHQKTDGDIADLKRDLAGLKANAVQVVATEIEKTVPSPKQAGFAEFDALIKLVIGMCLIVVGLCVLALCAHADPAPPAAGPAVSVTAGPTVPVVRLNLTTKTDPVVLAAGAGAQVQIGFLPQVIAGKTWDMLGVELAGFYEHSSTGVDSLSAALMGCTFSGLLCGGVGRDFYVSAGLAQTFVLAAIGFSFGLSPPAPAAPPSTAPTLGVAQPPASVVAPPANVVTLPF